MIQGIILANITIDCRDAHGLCRFYEALLGWQSHLISGFPVLTGQNGITFLFSEADFDYVRPVWPEEAGQQQKQMHFDFHVDDLPSAVSQALSLGATVASAQYGGRDYVTLLDPEGHPICLCQKQM